MTTDASKTYVLDTSVLLADPQAMSRFGSNLVVLPLVVINELEAKRNDPELGYNARRALRELERLRVEHGSLTECVAVNGDGGRMRVEINHQDMSALPEAFRSGSNDHRVLAVGSNLTGDGATGVVIVSKDLPLRLKASVAGLNAEEFMSEQVADSGWSGVVTLKVDGPVVSRIYEHGWLPLSELGEQPDGLLLNTGLVLKAGRQSALARVVMRDGEGVCVERTEQNPELFGVRPKSAEQHLAMAALRDPAIGVVSLGGRAGTGKMEPLTNRIPVPVSAKFPDGWATVGTLEVGDNVFAADGTETRVIGFSPVRTDEVYEVVLSDGQIIECGAEHLWKVSSTASRDAWTPLAQGNRSRRYEDFSAEASQWRELASRIGPGVMSTVDEISRLTDKSHATIRKVTPKALQGTVVVDRSGVMAFDMDSYSAWLTQIARERGTVQVAGRRFTESEVGDIGLVGYMTIADICRRITGSFNDQLVEAVRTSVSRSGSEGKESTGSVHVPAFPADETLILLAERLEFQATRSDSGVAAPALTQILSTAEMLDGQTVGRSNWAVPTAAPILSTASVELPLDPYVLGVWLGDGGRHHGIITSADQFLVDEVGRRGFPVQRIIDPESTASSYAMTGLRSALRQAGVDIRIDNPPAKTIPRAYMRASIDDRLDLLRGLMDTDGFVDNGGSSRGIDLTCETLASDTLELVRSLGIVASMSSSDAAITEADPDNPGQKRRRVTGTRYRIHFTTDKQVFLLPRKVESATTITRCTRDWLYVKEIRRTGRTAEMRCLAVDNPEHLYLTAQFVPTHNTLLALAAGLEAVMERKEFKRIMVFRPVYAVGGQDLGFVPGTLTEKMADWSLAIFDALSRLGNEYLVEAAKELIDVLPLTHLRGRSITDAWICVDEAQNLELSVLTTAMSRLGEGSKIVLCHDMAQRDNLHVARHEGMVPVIEALKGEALFSHTTLTKTERSPVAEMVTRLLDSGN